jgi:glycosyltransferase involved in cell wall biosynthesis
VLHGLPSMWRDGASGPSDVERELCASADRLIAPGPLLPRLLALPAEIVPPGVDPALRGVAHPRSPVRRWLCVGTVSPIKGHDLVVGALEKLGDATLTVVGDDTQFAEYAARLRAPRTRWLGTRQPAELPAIYADADVLILASRSENAPLVVLEALAAGLPVVAADVGGVAELCADRAWLRLFRPESVAALVGALTDLRLPSTAAPPPAWSWRDAAAAFARVLA